MSEHLTNEQLADALEVESRRVINGLPSINYGLALSGAIAQAAARLRASPTAQKVSVFSIHWLEHMAEDKFYPGSYSDCAKEILAALQAVPQIRECLVCGARSDDADSRIHPDGYCSQCEVETHPVAQAVPQATWIGIDWAVDARPMTEAERALVEIGLEIWEQVRDPEQSQDWERRMADAAKAVAAERAGRQQDKGERAGLSIDDSRGARLSA